MMSALVISIDINDMMEHGALLLYSMCIPITVALAFARRVLLGGA